MKRKWQPIETAPKDGTSILIYGENEGCHGGNIAAVYWEPKGFPSLGEDVGWKPVAANTFYYGINCDIENPTKWMPLPEEPT